MSDAIKLATSMNECLEILAELEIIYGDGNMIPMCRGQVKAQALLRAIDLAVSSEDDRRMMSRLIAEVLNPPAFDGGAPSFHGGN